MTNCIVGIADAKVSGNPSDVLVTYALGSCIALALYDPHVAVGGLLHFMLPDSRIDREGANARPCKFADTGVRWILRELENLGASRDRLFLWMAGGASVQNDSRFFQVGSKNDGAIRRILARTGLRVAGEDVGGSTIRSMGLELGSGICWVEGLEAGAKQRTRFAWRGK